MTLEIYRQSKSFPKEEQYGLTSQSRRAAVSVANNIAEGKGRSSDRELIVFLHHARGSLLEVETQLVIARELGYLEKTSAEQLLGLAEKTARMLNALINSLKEPRAALKLQSPQSS